MDASVGEHQGKRPLTGRVAHVKVLKKRNDGMTGLNQRVAGCWFDISRFPNEGERR